MYIYVWCVVVQESYFPCCEESETQCVLWKTTEGNSEVCWQRFGMAVWCCPCLSSALTFLFFCYLFIVMPRRCYG